MIRPLFSAIGAFMILSVPAHAQDPVDVTECGPCGGVEHRDTCVAGVWQATRNGPAEWLRRQGVPITITRETPYRIQFFADGQYIIYGYEYGLTATFGGHTATGDGHMTGGTGCWSADGTDLHLCHADGGPTINAAVNIHGRVQNTTRRMFPEPKTTWNYNCSANLEVFVPTDKAHDPIYMHMTPTVIE